MYKDNDQCKKDEFVQWYKNSVRCNYSPNPYNFTQF